MLFLVLWFLIVMIYCSVTGTLGVGAPLLNGSGSVQAGGLPFNGLSAVPVPGLAQMVSPIVSEPIGIPSECLLLKNMFDPATEVLSFTCF